MRVLAAAVIAGAFATSSATAAPLTTTEILEFQGHRYPIPLEVYLEPASTSRIAVKVAGNLRAVQSNISGLLSDVIVDDCDMRIALQVDRAVADGDHIRIFGRVQVTLYTCRDEADRKVRSRLISNIVEVEALLDGRIEDNCLHARLDDLALNPSGLVGGVMNLFNITQRITTAVKTDLNQTLADEDLCFDMPDVLKAVNAHVTTGGFRDFGGGEIGFVVRGRLDVTAQTAIALIEMLPDLGNGCDCD